MKLPHLLAVIILSVTRLQADDFFVAKNGLDTNPGTFAQPWKTIQKAASLLQAGDTVFVRKGIYKERVNITVSGSVAGPISLRNYGSEKVIIDASRLVPTEGNTGLFLIEDQSFLIIQGFELRNYRTSNPDLVPSGIYISGACEHIELRNNNIHHIANTHAEGNAFGIAVYGTAAISNVIIDGNKVHHLKTGNSESVVLNGNVSQFEVTNNEVYSNNNIGIDFIGFEGTSDEESLDQARDGICRGNKVWNINSRPNPSYKTYAAGGIYCDGATRIIIENNHCFQNDIGVEIASEHFGKSCSEITVRNNWIYRNRIAGIALGGYDAGRGSTEDCVISNNTFYLNDTRNSGSGEILLQYYVSNTRFIQNLFWSTKQGLFVGNQSPGEQNTFDYNLYYAPRGDLEGFWEINTQTSDGLAAWQTASGQDVHSLFAKPVLINPSRYNLHLSSTSPAINTGDPLFSSALEEKDIDGEARVQSGRVDIGADEFFQ